MTNPISAINPAAATSGAAPTPSATGAGQSLLDPQAFLQLLVAQLRYQDPTSPVDTSSFMQQTATLSQVQTMNTMSTTLTALVNAQQAQSAMDLIGKTATYVDASGAQVSGVVSGASMGATGATVKIGLLQVPLSNIVEVSAGSGTTPP